MVNLVGLEEQVREPQRIAEIDKVTIESLARANDQFVAENVALKAMMSPETISDDVLNAFSDTEEIDSESFDEYHTSIWVRNPEEIIKAVLAVMAKPDTPATDATISEIEARAVEQSDDKRRMDWLVSKTVNVREPRLYGSHHIFWSQRLTDEEDDYHATSLREQIDAEMSKEKKTARRWGVRELIGSILFFLICFILACWLGYVVGFDKGVSSGVELKTDGVSWDCQYSVVTKFAICDGRTKQ